MIWRQLVGHFGLLDGANGDRSLADLIESADSGPLSMELIPGLPGLVYILFIKCDFFQLLLVIYRNKTRKTWYKLHRG